VEEETTKKERGEGKSERERERERERGGGRGERDKTEGRKKGIQNSGVGLDGTYVVSEPLQGVREWVEDRW